MFNSNQSSLRIAEELTPKNLPGAPIWEYVEPNSYGDFGGETKNTARMPIAADRQRRKGTVTDLDASASFQTDFTTRSLAPTIQGFMFADWRKKTELAVTAVTAASYTVAAGGAGFAVGSLLFGSDFPTAANNGLKKVTASAAGSVSVAGLAANAETGTIVRVGVEGAAGDLALTLVNGKMQLNATTLNLTTLGLIPGEWVWLGGDLVGEKFVTAVCNGFYRVYTIAAGVIVFDRAPDNAVADTGAGKTIRMYFGQVLKNESDPTLQKLRTYQAERTYNTAADKIEYVLGLAANELKLTTKVAAKLVAELDFVGLDAQTAVTQKAGGTRPAVKPQTAYSSSSDYSRLRITNDVDGTALAVYVTDLELKISNGVDVDKAIGTLGGVAHSLGDFEVTGSVEAFFSSTAAIDAVKANTTASLDFATVANVATTGVGNQAVGWLFDLAAVSLGNGRLKVEKDKKIKLPLDASGFAHDVFNHTLLLVNFQYLPQIAL